MPYQRGTRLPGESASRIGHLEVLKSPLVQKLCQSFENPQVAQDTADLPWVDIPEGGKPLRYIFGVDGSLQIIRSDISPYSSIAFVKTAMLRLDEYELSKVDKESPHPYILRDILSNSAVYHATAFPLENVEIPGMTNYHAIRNILFESMKDPSPEMEGEILETLKWLAYQKWGEEHRDLTEFECPHCHDFKTTLPFDAEIGECPFCQKEMFITDWLGFHQEMAEDSAPEGIASTYMGLHETLLLFTAIRNYWQNRRNMISECLFVKDGPLSIRAQYSKLVEPIRHFLAYALHNGYPIHILGQEKSGRFYDHFQFIGDTAPSRKLLIPSDNYIKSRIQHRPLEGAPYGNDTNYGAKLFVKLDDYHKMVLNIPIGEFEPNPMITDLIGYENIFATIPKILSNQHEGALLPVELAHGIASLSTYPSAKILKLFTEAQRES